VIIEISDTGTGIPEAARAHVFDPFFTTKTTFRVRLPIADRSATAEAA